MCHALLSDPKFFLVLCRIDEAIAAEVREAGCPVCQSNLHRANYERKPRGDALVLPVVPKQRLSFCCGKCRKRATPPSVIFLGRRVFLGVVVLLGFCRHAGQTPAAARAALGNPCRQTLARWRGWWRDTFTMTPTWLKLRGRLDRPIAESELPQALVDRVSSTSDTKRISIILRQISPLSTRLTAKLADG